MRLAPPPVRPTVYDQAEADIPAATVAAALEGVSHVPFWLDRPDRPAAAPALSGAVLTDLLVVGGGFAGLWAALRAKERDPQRRVVLVEGRRIGWAASGRNGGFCEASLTHGRSNGERHASGEVDQLDALGRRNLTELLATVERYGIDCAAQHVGTLSVAVEPYQLRCLGDGEVLRDARAVRALVDSPLFLGGEVDPATVLLDPARLAWGLARVIRELGVEIYENTVVRELTTDRDGVVAHTRTRPRRGPDDRASALTGPVDSTEPGESGRISADQVVLATNAFPSLLRRTRLHVAPVYDYAIVTEPLSREQRAALGWRGRQGLADLSNRFHYWRLTPDDRVLYGGYDAVYHYGRSVGAAHDTDDEVFARLTAHLLATFPPLGGIKVTHAWGGAIDMCTRAFAFYTQAYGGRVVQAQGFTGLGVAATRFAADVMLDLLSGDETELTRLGVVRRTPLPFPPEPATWLGVRATVAALSTADRREGRRGPWLRLLDALKIGVDS